MNVPGVRLGGILEWTIAAGCILLVVALGSTAVRQLRDVPAFPPVIAEERPAPEPPASMFSGAVSVPLLLLSTGAELRVGERASEAARRLDAAWQIGADAVERAGRTGSRVVRRYDDGLTQFAVVVDLVEGKEETVGGIYVR